MRRPLVTAAAVLALLAPVPAFAQESRTPSPTATNPQDHNMGPVSPSPSPQQTPHMDCYNRIDADPESVSAWGLDGKGGVNLVIQGDPNDGEGQTIVVRGYVRPNTEPRELARVPVEADGKARVFLRLQGNTRLSAFGGGCFFSSGDRVIPVKARLGNLHAVRNAARDYTFSAFYAGPDGKVGNLYRVLPDGRQVLTSQTRMSGEFVRINRTFLGSGRFGFVLRTGDDINSLGASTNVRDTVIH